MTSPPSVKKRKLLPTSELSDVHSTICDLLVRIKPNLGTMAGLSSSHVLRDLEEVASLAQSFSRLKLKAKTEWKGLADEMDREGVSLWNASIHLRHMGNGEQDASSQALASLRVAGYRLIESGMDLKPTMDALVHAVQLASKAAAALNACGLTDAAGSVLETAAKYEEQLRHKEAESDNAERHKALAVTLYFSGRMEAAAAANNESVAYYMLQQVLEEQRISLLPDAEVEMLASRVVLIGRRVMKGPQEQTRADHESRTIDPKRGHTAAKWFRSALKLLERLDEDQLGIRDLKRASMRNLARAFFAASASDPTSLVNSEATVDELLKTLKVPNNQDSGEHMQLLWMKFTILKKRTANESDLTECLKSLIQTVEVTEDGVTNILTEMLGLSDHHPGVVITTTRLLLARCLTHETEYSNEGAGRALLSLLVHCKKSLDRAGTIRDIELALSDISARTDFLLNQVSAVACQTMLVSIGDRFYNGKMWNDAASWYLLCAHAAFRITEEMHFAKCLRKAALCYVHEGDFSKASFVIQRCPADEASTCYVRLLTAIHQCFEDQAIAAIKAMIKAPDFDRKLLLMVVQLAHESHLKALLQTALEALLSSLNGKEDPKGEVDIMILFRCLVRLIAEQLHEPGAHIDLLVSAYLRNIRAVREYVNRQPPATGNTFTNDLSWLWKTTYNVGVQGCRVWEDKVVCELFDVSVELMEACEKSSVVGHVAELVMPRIMASFVGLCGRVFSSRSAAYDPEAVMLHERTLASVLHCRELVGSASGQPSIYDSQREQLLHIAKTCLSFQVEKLIQLRRWEEILPVVTEAAQDDAMGIDTLEMISHLLWTEDACPTNVLYASLEAILHASLERQRLSLAKFSRWLRAICSILLARGKAADRLTAMQYMKQAVDVIAAQDPEVVDEEQMYPLDERQWLLTTAFNTGIEVFRLSEWEAAKTWFELATAFCPHVPNGETVQEKISDVYSELLDRFSEK